MRFYLAGRYGRRKELLGRAVELVELGFDVTSRWIEGEHEAIDGTAEPKEQRQWALDDMEDIKNADALIYFAEPKGECAQGSARGGRHVEVGYAMGLGKTIYLIGEPENVFHFVSDYVCCFGCWEDILDYLGWGKREDVSNG